MPISNRLRRRRMMQPVAPSQILPMAQPTQPFQPTMRNTGGLMGGISSLLQRQVPGYSPFSQRGLFGFMPQVSPFQTAINRQPQGLFYNPIVGLPDIPKPDPFGFFTPKPDQRMGQNQSSLASPANLGEQAALNIAMGRSPFEGIDTNQLTRRDIQTYRRAAGLPSPRSIFGQSS